LTRTLLVSDLHLGGSSSAAVLEHRPAVRQVLLQALRDIDRLILLGDVLELRHGPRREALARARAFFEELGEAFSGREVVVLAGNHDHALVETWLRGRDESEQAKPLGLEQRFEASEASSMLAMIARWAHPARLSGAYPGLWLRPDVYATHGHQLDCHLSIPTMECLGIGMTARVLRRPASTLSAPADYEGLLAPVYAWIDAVAHQAPTSSALNGQSTVKMWRALGGDRSGANDLLRSAGPAELGRALRRRAIAVGFPLAVGALNRAGLGSFDADITPHGLRRAGLRAMGQVASRLGLGPAHVIFGHTHRAGPLPGDEVGEWLVPGGARLMNVGCWTYDSYFLTRATSENPYWPGGAVLVEDSGPPVLMRLLGDLDHAALAPAHGS
jgi:hypothetical protein